MFVLDDTPRAGRLEMIFMLAHRVLDICVLVGHRPNSREELCSTTAYGRTLGP
jgi:hypothetical protein